MRTIGYWTGNDTPNDSASNNLHGAWTGTPAYTPGTSGDAFLFDGTNRVTVPDNVLFDFLPGDAFTIDFNFRIDDYNASQRLLINQGPYASAGGWGILANIGGILSIMYGSTSFNTGVLAISLGVFYRLKVAYDNGTWNVYFVDMTTPVKTQTGARFLAIRSGALSFGGASNGGYAVTGAIDNITLYNNNQGAPTMNTNALNQVYKTAIVAVEECPLSGNVAIAATSIPVAGAYITNTPFIVGKDYIIRDESFTAGADGLPNAERIQVTGVSSMTAVAKTDGIGYTIGGTIDVIGYTVNGFTGGLVNAYTTANHASILTPGTEIAIQSADFNCRFKTLTDAPKIDFDDEASRFATGDEGRDQAIAGARSAEISFTEKLSWAGAVTTIPTWTKLMRTMGHIMKTYTTKGIGFLPHTWANETTATIWIVAPENGMNPTSTIYRYCGAHGGNGSSISVGKIGDVYMLTGKYNAAYIGTKEIAYSAARALTSPGSKVPEVMLSNNITVPAVYGHNIAAPSIYATVAALVTAEVLVAGSRFFTADGSDTTDGALATAKGSAVVAGDAFKVLTASTCSYQAGTKNVEISQFSLDFGGMVNPFIDQATATGNAYYATQDRDPKFTCNPYHVATSKDDMDFVTSKQITGIITVASALTSPHITIEIPNAQLMSPALASREGYVNTNRTYRCLRNDTGVGVKESALPKGAMYELLIGARA